MVHISHSFGKRSGSSKAGAGGMMFGGAIFMIVGALFTAFVGIGFFQSLSMLRWQAVSGELLACEVEVRENGQNLEQPFLLTASYRYRVDETDYTGNEVKLKPLHDDSYESLALRRKEFLEADPLTVYIDPADPGRSVLLRESLWIGLVIPFPLVFVVVGVLLFRSGWKARKQGKSGAGGEPVESLADSARSSARTRHLGPYIGLIFFLVFATVGGGLLFPMLILPWQKSKDAESWIATPAEVIWSRVTTHHSDDSTTYGIDIFYRYQFNGVEHRSNRYGFSTGTSSGYSSKKAVVDRFPAGREFTCNVNPELPERAVIRLEQDFELWFLIPLLFLLVGLGGVVAFAVHIIRQRLGAPSNPDQRSFTGGTSETTPQQSEFRAAAERRGKLIGTTAMAIIWNAIVAIIASVALSEGGLMIYLFLIPFFLVGIFLIGALLHAVLGMFNPRTNLRVRPGHPRLGESFLVRWNTHGSLRRLRNLTIRVECIEKATYTRGSNRSTAESPVYRLVVAKPGSTLEQREGRAEILLPADLVASWDGGNNEIEWKLRVQGEIKPGPDIDESHVFTVLPAALADAPH